MYRYMFLNDRSPALSVVDYGCQQHMLLMPGHIVCVLVLSISCWQEPKHYEIVKNINVLFLSVRYKRQAL